MITRPPVEGNTCNLECIRKKPIKTFVGPVKVVLVDIPRRDYCERIWYAGFLGFAYLLIGFTSFTMLLFSCTWKIKDFENNLHIFFCTLGLHLFMPLGIFMITNVNGPSAPLKPCHRRCSHAILLITSATLVLVSSSLLLMARSKEWPDILTETGHCFFGFIACLFIVLAVFFGPIALIRYKCTGPFRQLHAWLGLGAFFSGAICFIQSLSTKTFVGWVSQLSKDLPDFLIAFCVISTLIVVLFPAIKMFCIERYCEPKI